MHGNVHTDAKHNTQGSFSHSMTVFSFRFPWDKMIEHRNDPRSPQEPGIKERGSGDATSARLAPWALDWRDFWNEGYYSMHPGTTTHGLRVRHAASYL
jgi:hypothetical protein